MLVVDELLEDERIHARWAILNQRRLANASWERPFNRLYPYPSGPISALVSLRDRICGQIYPLPTWLMSRTSQLRMAAKVWSPSIHEPKDWP